MFIIKKKKLKFLLIYFIRKSIPKIHILNLYKVLCSSSSIKISIWILRFLYELLSNLITSRRFTFEKGSHQIGVTFSGWHPYIASLRLP